MEGGGSCSRVLGLPVENARDRVVDMMVDDGGEEGEESCCRSVSMQDTTTSSTNELSVKIMTGYY
jgi:hypothetical protein